VNLWINAIAYQATWLLAIGGAARGWWWLGPATAAVFALWQLRNSKQHRADARLLLYVVMIGFVVDSAFAASGMISYRAAVPWPELAPLWIVALWASFALTLNHSLAYLQNHLRLAAVLGAIGAPLAYSAAARWEALGLAAPVTNSLLVLAATWALLTPALSVLAARLSTPAVVAPALRGTAP
jgi:hypothetical protein